MQRNSLAFHLQTIYPFIPLHLASIVFTSVSLMANNELLDFESQHDETLQEWAHLCLNSLLIAGVYMCVHLFPLNCIYKDSQLELEDSDDFMAAS